MFTDLNKSTFHTKNINHHHCQQEQLKTQPKQQQQQPVVLFERRRNNGEYLLNVLLESTFTLILNFRHKDTHTISASYK